MPPRSLRRGDKCPNPGVVRKGCPRPKALRFDSPQGGPSPFGTGQYSGNIMQGGVALQPQDYLLDGITPMPACIVITGAATVAPDATTDAAVFMARNIVLSGASASLSAATNCKGLLGFVSGKTAVRGGAHLHMDKLGRAGNFGDLSPDMLVPAGIRPLVMAHRLRGYAVKGRGAAGGARTLASSGFVAYPGNPGAAAGPMQTGGGGGGLATNANCGGSCTGGAGGGGGPCCGGAAGGPGYCTASGYDAGDYGGPGGDGGHTGGYVAYCPGGAGDPPGADWNVYGGYTVVFHAGAGGGLLYLFSGELDVAAGCMVSSDGSPGTNAGTNTGAIPGSAAGGGCVVIVTRPGGYRNNGTVRAAGGVNGSTTNGNAGPGGAGSVNIFELAAA